MEVSHRLQQFSQAVQAVAAKLSSRASWRLWVVVVGMLVATGPRTVAAWLRAAQVRQRWRSYYNLLCQIAHKISELAEIVFEPVSFHLQELPYVVFVLDDTPTKRYGRHVQGAGLHRNPTPGPAGHAFLYGHVWVTLAVLVRHSVSGIRALPLLSRLFIPKGQISKLPPDRQCPFRTKLELAEELFRQAAAWGAKLGKRVWMVVDGFYGKGPLVKLARNLNIVLISRLRKNAALWTLPPARQEGHPRRGRPRKYGTQRISLAQCAADPQGWQWVECRQYGRRERKRVKSFLATYPPAGGTIRVVIVQEKNGCHFFFSSDPEISARQILEAMADRWAVEQTFQELKQVCGAGEQQLRDLWANIAAWHLHLWLYTLVELWAWDQPPEELCDRGASPWDDPARRPSHADRRRALRQAILEEEFSALMGRGPIPPKILQMLKRLLHLVL